MSNEPLLLNAAMQFSPHGLGMFDQSYIMAELLDADLNALSPDSRVT